MTVVVGYVPTETGFFAVREAAREAKSRDLAVVIVNVVGAGGFTSPTAAGERSLDAVTAYLTKRGVPNTVRHVTDDAPPADILLSIAKEVNAELIVLGAHPRSWIARRLLGSTTQSVVMAGPCPVLIVPDVDPSGRNGLLDDDDESPPKPGMSTN
jgi:nucleotide-binding universal stress UspA family protein